MTDQLSLGAFSAGRPDAARRRRGLTEATRPLTNSRSPYDVSVQAISCT